MFRSNFVNFGKVNSDLPAGGEAATPHNAPVQLLHPSHPAQIAALEKKQQESPVVTTVIAQNHSS